ncbi:hypothetical protein B0H14DRAFT_176363 [Mycena olivaceomarginata]|nr:hypothetical protein B0H14DRAFT_176363 [Mycena olivaceomarginata]
MLLSHQLAACTRPHPARPLFPTLLSCCQPVRWQKKTDGAEYVVTVTFVAVIGTSLIGDRSPCFGITMITTTATLGPSTAPSSPRLRLSPPPPHRHGGTLPRHPGLGRCARRRREKDGGSFSVLHDSSSDNEDQDRFTAAQCTRRAPQNPPFSPSFTVDSPTPVQSLAARDTEPNATSRARSNSFMGRTQLAPSRGTAPSSSKSGSGGSEEWEEEEKENRAWPHRRRLRQGKTR